MVVKDRSIVAVTILCAIPSAHCRLRLLQLLLWQPVSNCMRHAVASNMLRDLRILAGRRDGPDEDFLMLEPKGLWRMRPSAGLDIGRRSCGGDMPKQSSSDGVDRFELTPAPNKKAGTVSFSRAFSDTVLVE